MRGEADNLFKKYTTNLEAGKKYGETEKTLSNIRGVDEVQPEGPAAIAMNPDTLELEAPAAALPADQYAGLEEPKRLSGLSKREMLGEIGGAAYQEVDPRFKGEYAQANTEDTAEYKAMKAKQDAEEKERRRVFEERMLDKRLTAEGQNLDKRLQSAEQIAASRSEYYNKGSGNKTGLAGQLKSDDERIAADLAFGKITPDYFSKMYSKRKDGDVLMRNVYLRATEMNPEFDAATIAADYQSFKNNAQRMQMSNLTRAEELLDTYQSLSDAVKRGDAKAFSRIGNRFNLELSGIDETNLKTMQTVMTEDLSRALTQSGATSDKKMDMAGDISDVMNVSNKAATEKIKIIHEIINANKKAIRDNWGIYGKTKEAGGTPAAGSTPKAGQSGDIDDAQRKELQRLRKLKAEGKI